MPTTPVRMLEAGYTVGNQNTNMADNNETSGLRRYMRSYCIIGTIGIFVITIIVILATSMYTVDSGYVAVIKTFGAIQADPVMEGLHWKNPISDKAIPVDIRLNSITNNVRAASKDLQEITTEICVTYMLVKGLAPKIYKEVGSHLQIKAVILNPAITESVKAVTAEYTAAELIQQRKNVTRKIQEALSAFIDKSLGSKAISGAIKISNVAVTDFQFSVEFNKAIEMKVKTEQQALQAANEKQTKITRAQASAEEKKIAATALAFEIETMAKAKANAIKQEAASLKNNPELIKLRLAEKWDGVLPQMSMGTDGINAMFDMSSMMKTRNPSSSRNPVNRRINN